MVVMEQWLLITLLIPYSLSNQSVTEGKMVNVDELIRISKDHRLITLDNIETRLLLRGTQ